ncbi:hypothetical protein AB4584_12850 [Vibrio splendidus]
MQVKHNDVLIATIGSALTIKEVSGFLVANDIQIPLSELALIYTSSEAEALRKRAYKLESDPLFIEWQFDQTLEKEKQWRDKVIEIKALYPLGNHDSASQG